MNTTRNKLFLLISLSVAWQVTAGRAVAESVPDLSAIASRAAQYRADMAAKRIPKVDDQFISVQERVLQTMAAATAARPVQMSKLSTPLLRVSDSGEMHAYIYLNEWTGSEEPKLARHGVRIETRAEELNVVQGWIPPGRLAEVAGLDFVSRISPPSYATHSVGSRMTEGDAVLKSDLVRLAGFDGTGVKVGVISDGVNNIVDSVALGDLPPSIPSFGSCSMLGSCNEGTAMLEIIHDIAPGAQLMFGAVGSSVEFINRLTDLSSAGAQVIVDDIGLFSEPMFQDGPVAAAVKALTDGGTTYVSAAGNCAEWHYLANFLDKGGYHDFGAASGSASDLTMDALVAAGSPIVVGLQWNDFYGASANDYDLLLFDESLSVLLASSMNVQNGSGLPREDLVWVNPLAGTLRVKIVIGRYAGIAKRLKLFVRGTSLIEEYGTLERSIFGHAAVSNVIAAGAVPASSPSTIETFSSRGPVEIYFPSYELRQKPDVVAPDGVSVTGVGGFSSPFYGTSAAAPHVAGVASLLRGGLTTSASTIRSTLKSTAVDLGAGGFDSTYGYGRVDALAAAKSLNSPPNSLIVTPSTTTTVNRGDTVNFTGSCTDPNSTQGMTYSWSFGAGSGIGDSTLQNPGTMPFNTVGSYTIRFVCTDGFGVPDPSPASVVVNVTARTLSVTSLLDDGSAGTLRDRINSAEDGDTILLPEGTIILQPVGCPADPNCGAAIDADGKADLDVTRNMLIKGAGSSKSIVDGNGLATSERVFTIGEPNQTISVSFEDFTIQGGVQSEKGGGVFVGPSAHLAIKNAAIKENWSAQGGGLWGAAGASLQLLNCTLSGNMADGPGGAIYHGAGSGLLDIQNSTLSGNSATGSGGAIYNAGPLQISHSTLQANTCSALTSMGGALFSAAASAVLTDTTIDNNTASTAGGIRNEGTLALVGCDVVNNQAIEGNAGGISNNGTLNITGSIVNGNTLAQGVGGGIDQSGTATIENCTIDSNQAQFSEGGGGIHASGTTTINRTTISNNQSDHATGGGGIYNTGTLHLINVTMAKNKTGFLNTGKGGAIYNSGQLEMKHVSIVENEAAPGHVNNSGGGIHNTGSVNFVNSIVAKNSSVAVGADCVSAPDIGTTFVSNGPNLLATINGCTMTGATLLVLSVDPMFSESGLVDNGGLAQGRAGLSGKTYALKTSSPAIDIASDGNCTPTDQRGVSRPQGTHCDLGAYELAVAPTPTPTPTPSPTPRPIPVVATPTPVPAVTGPPLLATARSGGGCAAGYGGLGMLWVVLFGLGRLRKQDKRSA